MSVKENDKAFIVTSVGEKIQWEKIDAREDMEKHLLQRNKRHLQQVTKERGIKMQAWFQKMIGNYG